MAKKIIGSIKLQILAGNANPSPPVGPALGQHGVNASEFVKAFNAQTQGQDGITVSVVVTIYGDRTFSFILKTPHLSLVNILAGRRIVPEFMPVVRDTDEVARVASRLLTDQDWRELMTAQLDEVVRPLEDSNASENVCRIIREMLNER